MKGKRRLLAGIVCGVLAAVFTMVYIADVRAEAIEIRADALERYGGDTVEVCVAACDIPSGQVIAESDVEMQTWVVDLLPEDTLTSLSEVVGQTAQVPLLENEPIAAAKIGAAISELSVPAGLCAVSVSSQDVLAVGGALKSGSLVDVYATGESGVTLLGEDILVLETSNSGAGTESSSVFGSASGRASLSWVTLAVTPESVEQLIAASQSSGLYFALPGTDSSQEDTGGEQGGAGQEGSGQESAGQESASQEASGQEASEQEGAGQKAGEQEGALADGADLEAGEAR